MLPQSRSPAGPGPVIDAGGASKKATPPARLAARRVRCACLHGSADVQDVAVADDVLLAFEAHLAARARLRFRSSGHELLVMDHLGADESAFEIGMDLPGGARCAVPAMDRPGAHLVFANGEEGRELEQMVRGAD